MLPFISEIDESVWICRCEHYRVFSLAIFVPHMQAAVGMEIPLLPLENEVGFIRSKPPMMTRY